MADPKLAHIINVPVCKHMITGRKGWLTQIKSCVRDSIKDLDENNSGANKQALKDTVQEMELKLKEIEAVYTRLMTIDQADVEKYDDGISDIGKVINVVLKEVRERFHNAEPRILDQPPEEGPEPLPGGPMLNREHLRPDRLTRDCTPIEFQSWTEEFRLYYSASGIDKIPLGEQPEHFCRCLAMPLLRSSVQKLSTPQRSSKVKSSRAVSHHFRLVSPFVNRNLYIFTPCSNDV